MRQSIFPPSYARTSPSANNTSRCSAVNAICEAFIVFCRPFNDDIAAASHPLLATRAQTEQLNDASRHSRCQFKI
jgi:hypothetical protein